MVKIAIKSGRQKLMEQFLDEKSERDSIAISNVYQI